MSRDVTYLVLKEPSGDIVADGSGVMRQLEVSFGLAFLGWLGFAEFRILAQMLAYQRDKEVKTMR